ncbi:STM4504/CBY_0614 family protein [Sphingobium sp. ba1]|jgi:hypothetical protein|uniref:STM4504/CBY_0614 family protein n=1 Tax=Sphingobium sp. ba1 TaxID=1522072 RepID=UPI0012E036B6|nr:hypothetical protein [Sphingobium sp. ba1]
MALPMIYSRRKRIAEKTDADVYQYNTISPKLRQQMLFVFDAWDRNFRSGTSLSPIYTFSVESMRTELGTTKLTLGWTPDFALEFREWFRSWTVIDDLLDAIEFVIQIAAVYGNNRAYNSKEYYQNGVAELNARMLEDGFGFQVEGGQLIQLCSTFLHQHATLPALSLLAGTGYAEANKEFRQAYQEFNQGNYDDCIHDCCNAFESVLKVILTKKGWVFSANDPAKKLLDVAFSNHLIPSYMQNEFTGLRTILESGVPTVRNKAGGHGAGTTPRVIPKHIASFQLHQTAAAIVLLADASN